MLEWVPSVTLGTSQLLIQLCVTTYELQLSRKIDFLERFNIFRCDLNHTCFVVPIVRERTIGSKFSSNSALSAQIVIRLVGCDLLTPARLIRKPGDHNQPVVCWRSFMEMLSLMDTAMCVNSLLCSPGGFQQSLAVSELFPHWDLREGGDYFSGERDRPQMFQS